MQLDCWHLNLLSELQVIRHFEMVILFEVYKDGFTFLVRLVSSHIVWSGLLHYVHNVF
jgi:hypothetical protein